MQLSPRESQAVAFIGATIAQTGRAPYQMEIAEHFGTTSRGFVWRMLKSLQAKGAITMKIKSPRGLSLTSRPS
jgi:SOS-response transcriptional repressor LexA